MQKTFLLSWEFTGQLLRSKEPIFLYITSHIHVKIKDHDTCCMSCDLQ